MLQNARVTAFIISELLRKNQPGGGRGGTVKITAPLLNMIRVNIDLYLSYFDTSKYASTFLDYLNPNSLEIPIPLPTRISKNSNSN